MSMFERNKTNINMETYYRGEEFQDPQWFRLTGINEKLTAEQADHQCAQLKKQNPSGSYRVVVDQ